MVAVYHKLNTTHPSHVHSEVRLLYSLVLSAQPMYVLGRAPAEYGPAHMGFMFTTRYDLVEAVEHRDVVKQDFA